MNGYIIPNEMARQLAVALYPGIAEYIQTHQEEYARFLAEEATKCGVNATHQEANVQIAETDESSKQ